MSPTLTLDTLALTFAFLFGAVVGSFLNVVIWRVPRGESIAFPGSHCPRCGKALRWYHNVPILSWLLLRGRCAYCRAPIDARYPMVELLTAVLAVACVSQFGLTWLALRAFVFVALLIALTYIDLDHWILPHAITWPGIALGLATAWIPGAPGLVDAAIGAAAGFLSFWLLQMVAEWIFKKEALGGGDLFLFAMIGAFLGWQTLIPVLFLASVQGSVIGGAMLLFGPKDPEPAPAEEAPPPAEDADEDDWVPPRNAVPFGPFLSLGALEMLLVGDWILAYVYRLMGLE